MCLSEQNMSPWCCCRSCPVSTAVRTALYTAQHRHYGHQSTSGRGRDRWWSTRGRVRAATSPVYSPGVVTAQGGRVQLSEPRTPDMKCDVTCDLQNRARARGDRIMSREILPHSNIKWHRKLVSGVFSSKFSGLLRSSMMRWWLHCWYWVLTKNF